MPLGDEGKIPENQGGENNAPDQGQQEPVEKQDDAQPKEQEPVEEKQEAAKQDDKQPAEPKAQEAAPKQPAEPKAREAAPKQPAQQQAQQPAQPKPASPVVFSQNPQTNKMANALYTTMQGMQQGVTINIFISPFMGMGMPMMQVMPGMMPMMYGMPQQMAMWQAMAQNMTNCAQMSRTPDAKNAGLQVPQLPSPTAQQVASFSQPQGIMDYIKNTFASWMDKICGFIGLKTGDKNLTPLQQVSKPMVDPRRMGGLVNQNLMQQVKNRQQMEAQMKGYQAFFNSDLIPEKEKNEIRQRMANSIQAQLDNPNRDKSKYSDQFLKDFAGSLNAKLDKAEPGQQKEILKNMEEIKKEADKSLEKSENKLGNKKDLEKVQIKEEKKAEKEKEKDKGKDKGGPVKPQESPKHKKRSKDEPQKGKDPLEKEEPLMGGPS